MFEKITEQKAQLGKELVEAGLKTPLSRRFRILIYLKQKKDANLPTTDVEIVNNCEFNIKSTQSFLRTLDKINMVEKVSRKSFLLTPKGERYIYETILPVFSNQQKIAKKIFFRDNLTRSDMVVQEKLKIVEDLFKKFGKFLQKQLEIEKKRINNSDKK